MIYAVTTQKTSYEVPWKVFEDWLRKQTVLQFDIETNVTSFWCTKSVKTLQFGSLDGQDQFVLEFSSMSPDQIDTVKAVLESWSILKIIHKASFEYIVLRFYDIEIANVHCTMVTEKILLGGDENFDYSLATVVHKYAGIVLDKSLQTSFGDGILTDEKIVYAATDVKHMHKVYHKQMAQVESENLKNVYWLEMRALLAFSECTFHGVGIDEVKWRENIALAAPVVAAAKKALDQWIRDDTRLLSAAIQHGHYMTVDTPVYNLNAPQQKKKVLQMIFPDIAGASKPILQKYLRDNATTMTSEQRSVLIDVLEGYTKYLNEYLLAYHKDDLIKENLLLPAGTIEINWNSRDQALNILKAVEPKLKSLDKEALANVAHPIFVDLAEYRDALKLTTSFGEKFLEHVEPDGRVRTNYNSIVSTGRASSASPNMQQIPAKESPDEIVKPWLEANPGKKPTDYYNRYRNCFTYTPGWEFVDSDYTGQELCLIAFVSQDDVWLKAIERGEDLHSVTAQMVFGTEWERATDSGCAYQAHKQKCKCAGHKRMRTAVKTINFGLCYGMSKFKLASTLRITVKEAQNLIDRYFNTFPQIKHTLDSFGYFVLKNGYTQTLSPFFRKRWFPNWESVKNQVDIHLAGIEYNGVLGRIERQGKNHPIQGSGSDVIKLAMWFTYKYIRDNNLKDKVHILLNVHDQLTTACVPEITEEWMQVFDKLMCDAALKIIPSGILKADTNRSSTWTK